MWWILFGVILLVSLAVLVYRGPVAALGTGCLISLLFPSWMTIDFLSGSLDLRIATSLILLIVNVIHPQRRINWKFNLADWSVFVLYFVQIASDLWQDGFQTFSFVRAFCEWSVPYIAGRLAIQNPEDWKWLTRVAMIVVAVFGISLTVEAVTRVNISSTLFGVRPADRSPYEQIRVGVKRAEGPTIHPIWAGMVQVLLLPWVIYGCYQSFHHNGPVWWVFVPFLSFLGILSSVSRGPILAMAAVYYFTIMFRSVGARKVLIPLGLLCVVGAYIAKDAIQSTLNDSGSRDWGANREKKVQLDGNVRTLTNVSIRWLTIQAYEPAIKQAGLLGFGTERTSTFPVNVPLGIDARTAVKEFWTIDCEYLLLLLRFGWLGVIAFILIGVFSIRNILLQSQFVPFADKLFPFAVAATLIAVLLTMIVEWMPHDYGYLYIWLCGAANGPRLTRLIESHTPRPKVRRRVSHAQ